MNFKEQILNFRGVQGRTQKVLRFLLSLHENLLIFSPIAIRREWRSPSMPPPADGPGTTPYVLCGGGGSESEIRIDRGLDKKIEIFACAK